MKKPLEKARTNILCGVARCLCTHVRTNVVVLNAEDVVQICNAVSELCRLHGCSKAAKACKKTSEAKTEEEFLARCLKACEACDVQRSKKKTETRLNLV